MTPAQAIAASGPVGGGLVVLAQNASDTGLSGSTAWSGGLIAGGVAVFLFLDRRSQKAADEHARMRRAEDAKQSERIEALEAELRAARIERATEVAALTERIIELLREARR